MVRIFVLIRYSVPDGVQTVETAESRADDDVSDVIANTVCTLMLYTYSLMGQIDRGRPK
jgi:hypothetical protein